MISSQILLLNTTDSCIIIIILDFALRFFARLKSLIVILFTKELKRIVRIVVSLFLMQIMCIPNSYLWWLLKHTAKIVWVAGPFKDFLGGSLEICHNTGCCDSFQLLYRPILLSKHIVIKTYCYTILHISYWNTL